MWLADQLQPQSAQHLMQQAVQVGGALADVALTCRRRKSRSFCTQRKSRAPSEALD
jgi:hypothetical protein